MVPSIKDKTERGSAAGLHDVVLVDVIAVVDDDGDAIAHDAGAAGHRDDMADQLGGGRGPRLGICRMSGQRFDDFGIERRALRRDQHRALLAAEVIGDDHAMSRSETIRSVPDLSKSPENSRCASGMVTVSPPPWCASGVDLEMPALEK